MAKLRGKAREAFLRKMAAGRRKAAARRGNRAPARKAGKKVPRMAKGRKRQPPKRRRNPELLTINPSSPAMLQARKAYKRFHGVEPEKVLRIGRGPNPKPLVAMGEVLEIVYQPRKGQRRGPAFFHKFKRGNVLATSPDGKRTFIIDPKGRKAVDFDLGLIG